MVENGNENTTGSQLCIECFNCKTKGDEIYCKFGVFKEKKTSRPIIYVSQDFDCPEWDEM